MRKGEKNERDGELNRGHPGAVERLEDEGSINPLAAVTDLADRYSISEREIFALLTKEADAAGINYLD